MRISTEQMFNQNINSILKKQTQTAEVLEQLSSGKKIHSAADDPVTAIGIDNLKQQNAVTDQFLKNINYAYHQSAITENQLGQAENIAMAMRDNILAAVNGTLTPMARTHLATDMQQSLEALKSIANTKDESGNYIFAGFKTDIKPFVFSENGDIQYLGDSGIKNAAIDNGVVKSINIAGDKAFMLAPNSLGDYQAQFAANQSGNYSLTAAKIVSPVNHLPDTYDINFYDNGANGIGVNVYASNGAIALNVAQFDVTNHLNFNGIEVSIDGEPKAGDSLTLSPQSTVSIFTNLQQVIDLIGSEIINSEAGIANLAQLLNNHDSGLEQIRIARGEAGSTLKSLDGYITRHEEEKIINNSALSMLEDLDYAEAFTEFEKQQFALNAVSSAFGRMGNVSLFDYL